MHKNMSWYYNKTINWGDTRDICANVENIFVCWNRVLEDTIQKNPLKSRKFSRKISAAEFRSSETFAFAVYDNFSHDFENYDFAKLYYDSMNRNLWL